MAEVELVESELPGIEFTKPDDFALGGEDDADAPYGRKADGTPKKRPGRPAGGSSGTSTRKAPTLSLAQLETELADKIVEVTIPFSLTSPLAGAVIDERAERTAKGLVTIAGGSPRFKKALEKAVKASAMWDVLSLPAGIAIAHMVEFGKLNPNAMISRKFHIDRHWVALGYNERFNPENMPAGQNGHVESRSDLFDNG